MGAELLLHGVLHLPDGQELLLAPSVLPPAADEVLVGATVTRNLEIDHARLDAAGMAWLAEEESAQIVVVDSVSLTSSCALCEDVLHLEEQFLRDKWFVPSWIELAFVLDDSRVIGVSEHLRKLALRDGLRRALRRLSSGEALLCDRGTERNQCQVTARVQFEGFRDERTSKRIDLNRVDQSTVEVLADVEITNLGESERAAGLRLVPHLHLDVLAALANLDLIHDVGDGLHGVGHVAIAKLFFGGDESDIALEECTFGDCCIGVVPEHARAHVDDHVPNLGVVGDVLE